MTSRFDPLERRVGWGLLLTFVLLTGGIVAVGVFSHLAFERNYRTGVEERLSAIAALKVSELTQWRRERLSDATVVHGNDDFARLMEQFLAAHDEPEARARLSVWLSRLQLAHEYDRVAVLDGSGTERLAVPDMNGTPAAPLGDVTAATLRSGQIAFLDFHRDTPDAQPHLAILVPIVSSGSARALGVLLLRIDPHRYLYPLLLRSPIPSPSFESLLVRREGREVVLLNDTRAHPVGAMTQRYPLSTETLPAVRAALGVVGIVEGQRGRGTAVIADLRPIPGSPWYLVSELDADEVLAPLGSRFRLTAALIGFMIASAGSTVAFAWRHQRARFDRERLTAAESLRHEQERFRLATESATDYIFDWDLAERVQWFGRVAEHLGYSPEALLEFRRHWIDIIHPEDRAAVVAALDAHITHRVPYDVEFRVRTSTGSCRHWWARATTVRDAAGRPLRMVGAVSDITERKQVEAELRVKTLAFEHSLAAQSVADINGRVTHVNAAFLAMWRCESPERARGRPIASFFADPEEAALVVDELNARGAWLGEFLARRDDGSTFISRGLATALRSANGAVIGYQSNNVDVTRERNTERALRESEERLHRVLTSAPFPIMLHAEDGEVVHVNDSWVHLTGYSREELSSIAEWTRLAYGERQAGVRRDIEALYGVTGPTAEREYQIRTKDGTTRRWEFSSAAAGRLPDGRRLVVSMASDVTERRALQASIVQADRLASMGMLAAGVAHEINNPLTYVLHNLECLSDAEAGTDTGTGEPDSTDASRLRLECAGLGERAQYAREALDGAKRIREIVRGLSTFSRVEPTRRTWVHLGDAIDRAASMAQNEIKYRARLVKQLEAVPRVWATDGELSQVFLNLLINAAHAIDEGSPDLHRITVRSRTDGHSAIVEVADTGKGIPPEHLERIFEPFFTTKPVGVGTGLGLAINRGIIAGLGGEIRVESEPGRGSRFVVSLPLNREGVTEAADRPARASVPMPAPGARVLVVDDEERIRRMLQRGLKPDFVVVTAGSGDEARQLLEADAAFDVILCDVMMPHVTGIDLHEWLAARHPSLAARIVFLTGGAFTPRAAAYLGKLDNPKVEKPVKLSVLRRVVVQHLRTLGQTDKSPGDRTP